MAWKNLAVHLDDSERCRQRLRVGLGLAQRLSAQLTGVFGETEPGFPVMGSRAPGPALRAGAMKVEGRFRAEAVAVSVAHDWLSVLTVGEAYLTRQMIDAARTMDLMIIGQYDADHSNGSVPGDLGEQIALHSGRPVLVVPYAGTFGRIEERVVVLWNGSREAVRAVNDALPLMTLARRVAVLAVGPSADGRDQDELELSAAALLRHLKLYGINAERERITASDPHILDLIMARTADLGATLMVIGTHGNYAYPFMHRGGATRHILTHTTLPVLMSY